MTMTTTETATKPLTCPRCGATERETYLETASNGVVVYCESCEDES